MEKELKNMGLLDDDGNLTVSGNVMVDGTPMTLEQVKALIAKPGTDLGKTVTVDGTKVTLRNLQTMIKIEDELKRLKETYLTDAVPFNDARKKSYASLQSQLQSTGLNLSQLLSASAPALNQNVRVKVSWDNANLNAKLVNLNGTDASSLSYDVSFKYRALPGSLRTVTDTDEKTMTIPAGSTTASQHYDFFDTDGVHCDGTMSWFLQAYNPQNTLFYTDAGHTNLRSVSFTVLRERTYTDYNWTTTAAYLFDYGSSAGDLSPGLSNPIVTLPGGSVTAGLTEAAKDIFGSLDNAWFTTDATLNLTSLQYKDTVMTAKPVLKTGTYAAPQDILNVKYWDGNGYSLSDPGSRTYNVHSNGDKTHHMDTHIQALTGGPLPTLLVFAPVSGTSVTYNPPLTVQGYQNGVAINAEQETYSIYDKQAPTVTAVTAPAGAYTSGMQVPVTVQFSEPVAGSPALTMKDGDGTSAHPDTTLSPVKANDFKGFYRSYLYTVPASPNTALVYKAVSGITDLAGNSGSYSPNSGNGAVSQISSTFTVSNDGVPAVTLPGGANTFYTKKNESVRIFWGQNLIGREGSAAQPAFTVAVYAGKFAGPADVAGDPVYTASVTNQSSFTIPKNVFGQVSSVDAESQNATPNYTVKVSAPDPDDGTKTLSAVGYVIVYPQPVRAALNTLRKYSITDDASTLNLEIGHTKGAAVSLLLPDGTLYGRMESPFTFTDMVGAPDADSRDSGIANAFSDLKKDGNLDLNVGDAIGSANGQISGSDNTLGMLMQFMDDQSLGSNMMNLLVTATEDPLVFKGLITVSQSYGEDTSINIGGADSKLAASGGLEYGLSITGYYEVEVRYDPSLGKWKMTVTGGGFDLGAMMGYSKNFNIDVEGIPLTAEFGLGAKLNLAFRAVRPTNTGLGSVQAAYINDFFNSLQINMYVSAFGGLGFDYEIVALKIGIFGQIDLGIENELLIRNYKTEDQKLDALSMSLYGTAGLKFVVKFLFVSYSTVLASFKYGGNLFTKDLQGTDAHQKIADWKDDQTIPLSEDPQQGFSYGALGGRVSGSLSSSSSLKRSFARAASSSGLSTVSSSVALESRDYLSRALQSWNSGSRMRSLLAATDSPIDIQSNAYPYANPAVTRDGKVLAYLSDDTDVNNTRASWATGDGTGAYPNRKGALSGDGTAGPDSSLALDGTSSFAAAAWTRQQTRINASAGGTVGSADVSAMTNSTKIMAGIYNGSSWTTADLTDAGGDNLTADLAPVVAADNGHAIVAWRSVSGSGPENGSLQYADVSNRILYKTYSSGSGWSDAQILYNGSQGGVKGLQAAMLDDGTAGLAIRWTAAALRTPPTAGRPSAPSSHRTVPSRTASG